MAQIDQADMPGKIWIWIYPFKGYYNLYVHVFMSWAAVASYEYIYLKSTFEEFQDATDHVVTSLLWQYSSSLKKKKKVLLEFMVIYITVHGNISVFWNLMKNG